MGENMEKFRHLDGSEAVVETPFIKVTFQHGPPEKVGINGCRIEDLIEIISEKLLDFQGRDLTCDENAEALYHLDLAREALVLRRRRREMQGLLGSSKRHRST